MLQWGRTLSSAEVEAIRIVVAITARLQWGRTLSSAEVDEIENALLTVEYASMGPHSFKCGSSILELILSL